MQLLTLRDKPEYLEIFENEAYIKIYEECLEVIEDTIDISILVEKFKCANLYINMRSITNDLIELLYKNLPFTSFTEVKPLLKNLIEEKMNACIYFKESNKCLDYDFYEKSKIYMEGFYSLYHCKSVYNIVKRFDKENTDSHKFIKINWVGREAESIIFDNKTYTFKLFYEKKKYFRSITFLET